LKYFKITLITILFLWYSHQPAYAQTNNNSETEIQQVFNKLVLAYGNAKSPPELRILTTGELQKSPAVYFSSPSPIIKMDNNLIGICNKFGLQKYNALSVILSHELAHYYSDDLFCTDFAFAIEKENNDLSDKLMLATKNDKMKMEAEADHKGLFYAAMAGFKPFNIYSQLMDSIYKVYKLPDQMDGYPSINERKTINHRAQLTISELYENFQEGMKGIESGNYDWAIKQFEELNKHFPSRENYNNVGVAKLLKGIQDRPLRREESKNPHRYEYPIILDQNSRLKQPTLFNNKTRAYTNPEELITLLKSAQKDFEKAISLDPDYTPAYINLAWVFDLLDIPNAAIGKIIELSKKEQITNEAKEILANAYYNAGMKENAALLWKELNIVDNEDY